MNGRLYDALMGRMISADPTVPDPMNAQAWNRYSYVGNDPLAFTDPSGFSWLSNFFNSVTNFFRENWRAVVQTVITAVLSLTPLGPALAAAASAAIVTGLSGGNLMQMLKAAAFAAVTAGAFDGLNMIAPVQSLGATFNPGLYAANVAGSALVGCASSAASGGSCASDAAAAAVGAGLAPFTNSVFKNAKTDIGDRIGGALVQATAGGLASVAGGANSPTALSLLRSHTIFREAG
jgi:hypothetical protein